MPLRNVPVTPTCTVCGRPLPSGRPRTTCSDGCRQKAWRLRHQPERFSWGLCGWVTRTRVRLGGVLSLGARLGRADGVGWPCLLGGLGCLGQCGDVET